MTGAFVVSPRVRQAQAGALATVADLLRFLVPLDPVADPGSDLPAGRLRRRVDRRPEAGQLGRHLMTRRSPEVELAGLQLGVVKDLESVEVAGDRPPPAPVR